MIKRSSKLRAHCARATHLAMLDDRPPGLPARAGTAFHAGYAATRTGNPRFVAEWEAAQRDLAKAAKTMVEVQNWIDAAVEKWPIPEGAHYEQEIALDAWGSWVTFDSPDAIVTGHVDFWWDAGDHIVVADAKTSKYDQGPPENLIQLVAYGAALCDLSGKPAKLAIGYARTSAWIESPIHLPSWARVVAAATAPNVPALGEHCRTCWEARLCPEGQAHIATLERAA